MDWTVSSTNCSASCIRPLRAYALAYASTTGPKLLTLLAGVCRKGSNGQDVWASVSSSLITLSGHVSPRPTILEQDGVIGA